MKTLVIVAKRQKVEAAALAEQIRERYPDKVVLADEQLAATLGWERLSEPELASRADLVVALGGDGTLIHAARLLRGRPVPILGVNLGSLGFLTELPQPELFTALEWTFAGKSRVESRMKLACRLYRGGELVVEDEVLNDVVINKGALARLTDYEMSIDGTFVTLYKSDGVIVATPTGSTAYSLSAGGPIVHPSIDCLIITPICPHSLTQRPIVLPGDQAVSLTLRSDTPDVFLTLDGRAGHPFLPADRIEVRKAQSRTLVVKNPRMDYFAILRQKLRWGER